MVAPEADCVPNVIVGSRAGKVLIDKPGYFHKENWYGQEIRADWHGDHAARPRSTNACGIEGTRRPAAATEM
jgi:hypothetical protein